MSKFIVPDAYGSTGAGENNDCSVRALSNVTGISYQEAHDKMKVAGRIDRKTCPNRIWEKVYAESGLVLEAVFGSTNTARNKSLYNPGVRQYRGVSIGKLIPRLDPSRSYAIHVRGHVFAVKNGKVLDSHPQRAGTRVVALYSI